MDYIHGQHVGQASHHGQAAESPLVDGADRGSSNVWKDTSAEEMYGSYLDNHSEVPILRPTMATRPTMGGHMHQDIAVGQLDESGPSKAQYSGRKRVWPGALILLLITLAALAAITYFGAEEYTSAQKQQSLTESVTTVNRSRKSTPVKVCELPNYKTSGGKIYASGGDDNTVHEVIFTGINWSGMENTEGVPHGLATGQSYIEDIAAMMVDQGINSVRLPLNAKMVLDNSAPDTTLYVNRQATNLNVDTYIDMIKVIVQGLAKEQIAVLLDIHKIDPAYNKTTSEPLWYTDDIPFSDMLTVYQTLATELCTDTEYNIVGIDIKNEPVGGCWPEDDSDDYCPSDENWPRAVETIGNAILKICPNWLIVAEGLYAANLVREINGVNVTYSDWFGASLQNSTKNPISLNVENKIVYAPHFYSPSVYPSSYFFSKQSSSGDTVSITEYPNTTAGNEKLHAAMKTVLDYAFGDAIAESGIPTFYGEFGGIYGEAEKLAGLTSTRTIEYMIDYVSLMNMSGGFAWSLNPDGSYDFNDEYKPSDRWQYGLYTDSTWSEYYSDYSAALKKLQGNGIIPCFSKTVSSSTSDSSSSSDSSATVTVESTTSSSSSATASSAATATSTAASSSTAAAATTATSTAASSATATATASSAAA